MGAAAAASATSGAVVRVVVVARDRPITAPGIDLSQRIERVVDTVKLAGSVARETGSYRVSALLVLADVLGRESLSSGSSEVELTILGAGFGRVDTSAACA